MPQNYPHHDLSFLGRRCLYNQIRFLHEEGQGKPDVEAWKVEDYRSWSVEDLVEALSQWWSLDRSHFCAYAENSESPEALVELLLAEDSLEADEEDRLFLIVFELWRRWVSHGFDIEFLADELDYQMADYNRGEYVDDKIDKVLNRFLNLLHEETTSLEEARDFFACVSGSCAHDLELFLYDFILDQLESGAQGYAQELHAQFSKWVEDKLWFDLLQVHWSDNEEAFYLLKKIYQALKQEPQVDLLLEIVAYLSEKEVKGQFQLFFELAAKQPLDDRMKEEFKNLAQIYFTHHESEPGTGRQWFNDLDW